MTSLEISKPGVEPGKIARCFTTYEEMFEFLYSVPKYSKIYISNAGKLRVRPLKLHEIAMFKNSKESSKS